MNILRSKKRLVIIVISVGAMLLVGVVAWQLLYVNQPSESAKEVIKRTNTTDYSDLSKDDIDARSKAVFGKSIDNLSANDVKDLKDSEGQDATPYEAARLLAAAGKIDKSIEVYKVVQSQQGDEVNQDFYRDYRNTLDEAGRHDEGTELMRQELELLKKQSPIDEIAVARVQSQISEREEYYK